MTEPKKAKRTKDMPLTFNPATTPLITRAALEATPHEALRLVPPCLAIATHAIDPALPFDGDCLTVLRPKGRHADQVTRPTISYAVLCALKWWGGGINIHERAKDGSRWIISSYSSSARELGHSTPADRIFADAQPRQTVKGASHVTRPAPGSAVVVHDHTSSGPSKWGARRSALAHAGRYAGLNAPPGYDVAAYLASLHALFVYHDLLLGVRAKRLLAMR
jgi:hypothetical protein